MAEPLESILEAKYKVHTSKLLNYFWIGFTLYTAFFVLSTTTTVDYIICQFFQLVGLGLFVPSAIRLIKWKFTNDYLKTLFFLYMIWQLFIIVRGFPLDYNNIKVMLFDAESGVLRFFTPLILLFPKNLLYYKKIVIVIVVMGIFFLLYDILFIKNLMNLDYENNNTKFTYEHFAKILSVPSGLLLLTFIYQEKRVKYIALVVIIVSILFAIYRARRALIILTLAPLVISYILYLYAQKKNFMGVLIPFVLVFLFLTFGGNFFDNDPPKIFRLLSDRGTEDTRSGVENYFYLDMKPLDWVIGKGIMGKYYCPNIDLGTMTDYRQMIETDYLYIILKGGIISLALLLLMAIPAVIKGLFHSKNILSKASAIWILLFVLELYPANVSNFSLHYMLFWIAIGICYSDVIRNTPEKSLIKLFTGEKEPALNKTKKVESE